MNRRTHHSSIAPPLLLLMLVLLVLSPSTTAFSTVRRGPAGGASAAARAAAKTTTTTTMTTTPAPPILPLLATPEDVGSLDVVVVAEQQQQQPIAKMAVVVNCPDCDLCDGSGRWVCIFFPFFVLLVLLRFYPVASPTVPPTHPPTHPRIDRFSPCICFSFSPSFPPPLGPDLARDMNAQDPGRHRDGARMVAYQGVPTVPEFRRKGGEVRQGRSGVGRDRLREGLHVPERWRRLLTR